MLSLVLGPQLAHKQMSLPQFPQTFHVTQALYRKWNELSQLFRGIREADQNGLAPLARDLWSEGTEVKMSEDWATDTWAPGCPNRLAHPGAQIMSALL